MNRIWLVLCKEKKFPVSFFSRTIVLKKWLSYFRSIMILLMNLKKQKKFWNENNKTRKAFLINFWSYVISLNIKVEHWMVVLLRFFLLEKFDAFTETSYRNNSFRWLGSYYFLLFLPRWIRWWDILWINYYQLIISSWQSQIQLADLYRL